MNLDGVLLIISKTESALRNMHCPFFPGAFSVGARRADRPCFEAQKKQPTKNAV